MDVTASRQAKSDPRRYFRANRHHASEKNVHEFIRSQTMEVYRNGPTHAARHTARRRFVPIKKPASLRALGLLVPAPGFELGTY